MLELEHCPMLGSASSPKAEPAPLAVVMLWIGAGQPQETALCSRKLLVFLVLNPSKDKSVPFAYFGKL